MNRQLVMHAALDGFPACLEFSVDDGTLDLGGRDAETVVTLLSAAVAAGSVVIAPYPTSVEISDPLRDRAQFAAVLAQAYPLPGWMRAWIPPDSDAEEVDNDGCDEVTY